MTLGNNDYDQAAVPGITITSPGETTTAPAAMLWADDEGGNNVIPTSVSLSSSEIFLFGAGDDHRNGEQALAGGDDAAAEILGHHAYPAAAAPAAAVSANPGRVSLAPSRSSQLLYWPLPLNPLPVPAPDGGAHLAPSSQTNHGHGGDEGYDKYLVSRGSSIISIDSRGSGRRDPFSSAEAIPIELEGLALPHPPPAAAVGRRIDDGNGGGDAVRNAPGHRAGTPLRFSPFGNAILPASGRVYTIQGTARFWAVIAGFVASFASMLTAISAMVVKARDSPALHTGCVAWLSVSVVLSCVFMFVISFLVSRREYQKRHAAHHYRQHEAYWIEMDGRYVEPGQQQ
ncbi:hypothetical protein SLS62_005818 [Diatrype stigma]|uniref:Uncharacterized protein n=1 Tax=Diatrype stigma TaxID=117547 RepID=A0AAN9YRU8_9PEZI